MSKSATSAATGADGRTTSPSPPGGRAGGPNETFVQPKNLGGKVGAASPLPQRLTGNADLVGDLGGRTAAGEKPGGGELPG